LAFKILSASPTTIFDQVPTIMHKGWFNEDGKQVASQILTSVSDHRVDKFI